MDALRDGYAARDNLDDHRKADEWLCSILAVLEEDSGEEVKGIDEDMEKFKTLGDWQCLVNTASLFQTHCERDWSGKRPVAKTEEWDVAHGLVAKQLNLFMTLQHAQMLACLQETTMLHATEAVSSHEYRGYSDAMQEGLGLEMSTKLRNSGTG